MVVHGKEGPPSRVLDFHRPLIRVEVVIPSRIQAVSLTVNWLMRLLRRSCCYSGREFAVETVLREALANAIIHGNRLDPKKIVRLCCFCDGEGDILIVVTDEGEGFDSSAIPSPLTGENINLERGTGIYLINQFADEVRFDRGGAEIRIRISARPKERSRGLEVG